MFLIRRYLVHHWIDFGRFKSSHGSPPSLSKKHVGSHVPSIRDATRPPHLILFLPLSAAATSLLALWPRPDLLLLHNSVDASTDLPHSPPPSDSPYPTGRSCGNVQIATAKPVPAVVVDTDVV
jgi:hypothetical protein